MFFLNFIPQNLSNPVEISTKYVYEVTVYMMNAENSKDKLRFKISLLFFSLFSIVTNALHADMHL